MKNWCSPLQIYVVWRNFFSNVVKNWISSHLWVTISYLDIWDVKKETVGYSFLDLCAIFLLCYHWKISWFWSYFGYKVLNKTWEQVIHILVYMTVTVSRFFIMWFQFCLASSILKLLISLNVTGSSETLIRHFTGHSILVCIGEFNTSRFLIVQKPDYNQNSGAHLNS